MKKILLLLTVVAAFAFQGCEGPEGPQGPQGGNIPNEMYELRNVNFGYNSTSGSYSIYEELVPQINQADVILIYRLVGTVNPTTPIWQSIPRTLYLPQGELDYDFDFTKTDFTIYAGGNFNLALTPEYLNNQTFRIVILPGYYSKNAQPVDYSDYNAVIKAYNIDESRIKILN